MAWREMILASGMVAAMAPNAAASAPPPREAFNDRLLRLSPELQRAAMRQAVTNNGQRCGRVERAGFQQPYRNMMMWTATCKPGGAFGVFVGRDGSVQVRPCPELVTLKLPRCR